MYISIRDDIAMTTGQPSLAVALSDMGYGAVELMVSKDLTVRPLTGSQRIEISNDGGVAELRGQAEQAGIRVSALLLGNNFNAEDKDAELRWIVRTCEVAETMGIEAVRIDAIMTGEAELPFEERMRIFSTGVKDVLSRTEGMKVRLGIENHGRQGNDPNFLRACLDSVGDSRLGLTIDTANFYWFGHPLSKVNEILQKFAPVTVHTHMKNIAYPESEREKERPVGWKYDEYVCPIPDGDINLGAYVKALKTAGYTGDLCVEDESIGRYTPDERRDNLRRAAEFLRPYVG